MYSFFFLVIWCKSMRFVENGKLILSFFCFKPFIFLPQGITERLAVRPPA